MFRIISDFLFFIGKKICMRFNFNDGSFIYLKLRAFDVKLFLDLTTFLKFLMLGFEWATAESTLTQSGGPLF